MGEDAEPATSPRVLSKQKTLAGHPFLFSVLPANISSTEATMLVKKDPSSVLDKLLFEVEHTVNLLGQVDLVCCHFKP